MRSIFGLLPTILLTFFFLTAAAEEKNMLFVVGKGLEGKAEINWSFHEFKSIPDSLIIRYAPVSDGAHGFYSWKYTDPIASESGSFLLDHLEGPENYVFQVGFDPETSLTRALRPENNNIAWSERETFSTTRPWGFIRFLIILGSLGLFIYGMKIMSEGIQNATGNRLQKILNAMTATRWMGLLSGFIFTAIIQSSSATTVMLVSFVNAGLISLTQSVGIIIGANIGTTITGWLVSFLSFRFNISDYAFALLAISVPLVFVRSGQWKSAGHAITGFALLITGLTFLREAVPEVDENSFLVQIFLEYSSIPVVGVLLFVMVGMAVTLVVQSSSAAMALTLTLCATGVLPVEASAAMILGENIGTTFTAEIASLVGNVHAKRTARVHSLFNIIGVLWMVFLIPAFLDIISGIMTSIGLADPLEESARGRQSATTALAAFHTIFNIANGLLLIWFVPFLVSLARKTVRSKGEKDEQYRLAFIDAPVNTARISVLEAQRQVLKYGEITMRMSGFMQKLISEPDPGQQKILIKQVKKYEEITDKLEMEISRYLRKATTIELSDESSEKIRGMLRIISDMERIGDIFYQMSRTIKRKNEEKIWFVPEQRENLKTMFRLIDDAFIQMLDNLRKQDEELDIYPARELENRINKFRNKLRNEYLEKMEKGKYNMKSGIIYNDLFSSLEKIGDHIFNISEAVIPED